MTTMTTAIAAEKTRITERIAKIDIERSRLTGQLNDFEAAERVMTQFTPAGGAPQRTRGRPKKEAIQTEAPTTANKTPADKATTPTTTAGRRSRVAKAKTGTISLSEAVLTACGTFPGGAPQSNILPVVEQLLGNPVRANHLGIALARLARAGRVENRGGTWFLRAPEFAAKAA